MNKILFNFLVVGVALTAIQSASAMNEGEKRSNRTKYCLRNFHHNKENKDPCNLERKATNIKKAKKPAQPVAKEQDLTNIFPKKLPSNNFNNELLFDISTVNTKSTFSEDDFKEWIETMKTPKKKYRYISPQKNKVIPFIRASQSEDAQQSSTEAESLHEESSKKFPKADFSYLFKEEPAGPLDVSAHEQAYSPFKHPMSLPQNISHEIRPLTFSLDAHVTGLY